MTLDLFDDRYGAGSYRTLLNLLNQPCVTFADIATRYGVTRERVRQWHRDLLPEAPSGHERQRLCALHQQRKRLFQDPLFRVFFSHARPHFTAGRIEPIRSRQGYRTRSVLIDKHLVALRDGDPRRYRGSAEFVYVKLAHDQFVFGPAAAITDGAALATFRNSFAALAFAKSSFVATSTADSLQEEHR